MLEDFTGSTAISKSVILNTIFTCDYMNDWDMCMITFISENESMQREKNW